MVTRPQPSLFNPEDYRARRGYPLALFDPLRPFLAPAARPDPLRVLDLGAGTGQAAECILALASDAQVTLVEPDAAMREEAGTRLARHGGRVRVLPGSGEEIPMEDASVDLLIVGSAWHWMNPGPSAAESARVLSPGGGMFVFEYQFPKLVGPALAPLNEWIRRQFNLAWKAPAQQPRGTLTELTRPLRDFPSLFQRWRTERSEEGALSAEELAQEIFSQSRFLHYERALPEKERKFARENVISSIRSRAGEEITLRENRVFEGIFFVKCAVEPRTA